MEKKIFKLSTKGKPNRIQETLNNIVKKDEIQNSWMWDSNCHGNNVAWEASLEDDMSTLSANHSDLATTQQLDTTSKQNTHFKPKTQASKLKSLLEHQKKNEEKKNYQELSRNYNKFATNQEEQVKTTAEKTHEDNRKRRKVGLQVGDDIQLDSQGRVLHNNISYGKIVGEC